MKILPVTSSNFRNSLQTDSNEDAVVVSADKESNKKNENKKKRT